MNIKRMLVVVTMLCVGVAFNTQAGGNKAGKRHVLNLVGVGTAVESTVPDIDGDGEDDPAVCFDVLLINAENRKTIGTATDCLSNIEPHGDGLRLVGTTYFHLPQGTLVTRGNTSVHPTGHPTVTPGGMTITHITGAASDENAIIDGTGAFSNSTGTVRLSGMVDMADLGMGLLGFDCIFVVDMD